MGAGCCRSVQTQQNVKRIIVKPKASKVTTQKVSVSEDDEYIEDIVCNENEIGENEMKNFELGDSKVLVIKQNGRISAIGSKCSHYGALLSMGALGDGRIRCPWHGACFNIETGDIEDYPGQDSIPCYDVKIEKGQVKVRAKKSSLNSNKRLVKMAKRDAGNTQTFIIVGGGPSGAICVETLRQNDFMGRIILVCKENSLPYDRVKVSKSMDANIDSILLRTKKFYDDNDIEVLLNTKATSINTQDKELTLNDNDKLKYDKIYIATGSSATKLNVSGHNLKNVVTLRNFTDSQFIMEKIHKDIHVVIVGVSFTGMEAASFLVKKVQRVTVIGRDSIPFRSSFGEEIGARIMKLFKDQKVDFEMNSELKQCNGNSQDELKSIELKDGRIIQADLLIMACGSILNTDFIKGSEITLNSNGSIDTNDFLETNVRDVYVGGDIANSPIYMTGKRETIGHYPLAQYHGRIAAENMCGLNKNLKAVPYFWTMLFGKSFRYTGHGKAKEIKVYGSLDNLKFVAFYVDDDDKVIAMSSCGRDPIVSQFAEFLSLGRTLNKPENDDVAFEWIKEINSKN